MVNYKLKGTPWDDIEDAGNEIRSLNAGTRYFIEKAGKKYKVVNREDTSYRKALGTVATAPTKQKAVEIAEQHLEKDFSAFVNSKHVHQETRDWLAAHDGVASGGGSAGGAGGC